MTNFKIDTSDFDGKFKKLWKETIPSLQEKGMGRAMLVLMGDCVNETPTVPLDEGWLRGSASVFVQGKFVADSSNQSRAKGGKATNSIDEKITKHEIRGSIGFNTPYAARLHEGIDFKFKEPSSGPKFLEAKLFRNGNSYLHEIADAIIEGSTGPDKDTPEAMPV